MLMYVLVCRSGTAAAGPRTGSVVMSGAIPCSSRVADPPRPAREELAASVRSLGVRGGSGARRGREVAAGSPMPGCGATSPNACTLPLRLLAATWSGAAKCNEF